MTARAPTRCGGGLSGFPKYCEIDIERCFVACNIKLPYEVEINEIRDVPTGVKYAETRTTSVPHDYTAVSGLYRLSHTTRTAGFDASTTLFEIDFNSQSLSICVPHDTSSLAFPQYYCSNG